MSKRRASSGEPLAKRTKHDFLVGITVLVGCEETPLVVHKRVACEQSAFFRTTIDESHGEAKLTTVRLPDINLDVFTIYLGWLYVGSIDPFTTPSEGSNSKQAYSTDLDDNLGDKILHTLISAFSLGLTFSDRPFRNALIDEFIACIEGTQTLPGARELAFLWSVLPHDSTLTRLCVDYVAFDMDREAFERYGVEYPGGFVFAVAVAGIRDQDLSEFERLPADRGFCFYHEHVEGEEDCEECKEEEDE